MTAQAQGFAMGLSGKHPVHQADGKWFPGTSRKDLEEWSIKHCFECAKNSKPDKEKTKQDTKSKEEKKD